MHNFRLSAFALAAALLAAPALAQETNTSQQAQVAAEQAASSTAGWWAALGDPLLSTLIQRGLDANLDIKQAHAPV